MSYHIIHTVHLALVHQGAAVTFLGFLLARWNAEDATEKHLVPSPLTIVEPKMLVKDATHAARVTSRIAVIGQSNHWFDNWSRLIAEACDGHTNYSKQLRHLVSDFWIVSHSPGMHGRFSSIPCEYNIASSTESSRILHRNEGMYSTMTFVACYGFTWDLCLDQFLSQRTDPKFNP